MHICSQVPCYGRVELGGTHPQHVETKIPNIPRSYESPLHLKTLYLNTAATIYTNTAATMLFCKDSGLRRP